MKLQHPGLLMALLILLPTQDLQGQAKFHPDDPLWKDEDQLPIAPPARVRLSQVYDFLENSFRNRPREGSTIPQATNINTLGQVPDSSWFTNRMGRQLMSIEELVQGPNRSSGPDQSNRWAIIDVKTEGVTPGFTIRDGRGEIYFIKFDPPRHPQLATSTEVIATKFFHAFGYNVPENHLALIRRDSVEISPKARIEDEEGKQRHVRNKDIDRIFNRAYQLPDGRTPVVASRLIDGTPLGPFKYHGTRQDDPNDIFAHQNRRELRGLRVFAAWLNHDDSRSINTLDMYVGKSPQGYVKHYLIDFGSCLGSGSIKIQTRRAGNEYLFEPKPILKAGLTLGLWDRPWRSISYPDYPAVGRFEGDFFDPPKWRPEYPNPAFDRMLAEDAFWATRILVRFTEPMIRAMVGVGKISDPQAADFLVRTLLKRQKKIVQHYLAQVNPLDDFRLTEADGGSLSLSFRNLGLEQGLATQASYRFRWFRFENATGASTPMGEMKTATGLELPLPADSPEYLKVEISTSSAGQDVWATPLQVYLRHTAAGTSVVGIDR